MVKELPKFIEHMDTEKLSELFHQIRKRPLMTLTVLTVAAIVTVVQGISYDWIKERWQTWNSPFRDLAGNYRGQAEKNVFNLCLQVEGDIVRGTMTWPEVDPKNEFYVDYDGEIKGQHVELQYSRNRFHPVKDSGDGAITPKKDGEYQGFWRSTQKGGNKENFKLTRIPEPCKIVGWDGEPTEVSVQ